MSAIFNGSNQAKYGDSGLQYQYGVNCSCAFWFKTDHDFSTSPTQALPFGIRNGTVINYAHIDLFGGINGGFFGWSFGTTTAFDQFTDNVGGWNDGEWHCVVFTRNAAVTKMFIDGAEVGYANVTDGLAADRVVSTRAAYGSVSIGARQNDTVPFDNYFPGNMAEVAIWSRTLSDPEAVSLYTNAASALSTDLDHYWELYDNNEAAAGSEGLTDHGPATTFDTVDHPPVGQGGSSGFTNLQRRRLLREKRAKAARLGLKRFRRGRFM